MSRLEFAHGKPEEGVTEQLRRMPLRAKSRGDLDSAVLSAAYYAKKLKRTVYVYAGNSYGSGVWRASYMPSDYLSPINNTGAVVYSVTPDLTVARHDVVRNQAPNASTHYVWVLRTGSDTPLSTEGPYGPHPLETAKKMARIGATEGIHDRAVSVGKNPEATGFKILRRYAAGTGDRLI